MKTYLLSIIVLIFAIGSILAQTNDDFILEDALQKNEIGKKLIYGKWTKDGGTETTLTYLGIIKTNKKSYKILNSSWIWGVSKRATNRIIVFNTQNQYIGNYYVTVKCDLPNRIENDKLIFKRRDCEDCDNVNNQIDFTNGIPEQIFISCKGKFGDLYSFDKTLTK